MFGVFKKKSLLAEEDKEFQIATFVWLLRNFGGESFYNDTVLVLPNREYFPAKLENEEHAAEETFKAVRKYAGMESWPCRLEKQDEDSDPVVSPAIVVKNAPNSPMGTFSVDSKNEITITYNPALVSNPPQLVATYAHELAHYLTGSGTEEPPGGWDNWEFATDIAATFMGFGIFMANSAFNFRQYTNVDSQGWECSRNGYLTENEHIYALAIFLSLKGIPQDKAIPHLKPNLKKLLKQSIREISKEKIVERLI